MVILLEASKIQSRPAAIHSVLLKGIANRQMLQKIAPTRKYGRRRPQELSSSMSQARQPANAPPILNPKEAKIHIQDLPESEARLKFHEQLILENKKVLMHRDKCIIFKWKSDEILSTLELSTH